MSLVTIIVPVYNGENYLSETLDSILKHTLSVPCEILVIDDGSSDSTSRICSEFGNKISYFQQENQGEFAATNRGLQIATGDYILVVSHDDPMFSSSLLPLAIELLESHPKVVCVYPDWRIIDARGQILKIKVVKEYSESELIGKFNCLPGPGAVFKREAALKIGGRRRWKFVSDYDFWLRLSRLGEFKRIPGVHAQWRSHRNSTTVSMKDFEMAKERISLMEDFTTKNRISPKLHRMALGSAYYYAARLGVFSTRIPAKRWLLVSFVKSRGWPKVANPLVVLFIFTLPLSQIVLKAVKPFSKRLKEVF
jgi:glycosyltransferase involved in cell wall biosynthesis